MGRTVTARYPRGEETRARILSTAIRMFGSRGFDGVSTRDIAAEAAVPAPSLRYYFESKQGLYIACLGHMQASLLVAMEPALKEAELLLADEKADSVRLIDAFCAMQEALVDHMIGGEDDGLRALFVIRHDLPSAAGESKFSGDDTVAYRMTACFTQIMMRISGNTLDAQRALIVAGLLNGQLTTIYTKRGRLAEMGLEIAGERLRWLRRTIRKQITAVLLTYCARPKAETEASAAG